MTRQPPGIAGRVFIEHHDSPFGRWLFAALQPHPALAGLVRMGWYARGRAAYSREKILPFGDAVLLFNLDGEQGLVEGKQVTPYREAWVSGLQDHALIVESGDTHMLGLRTSPWGFHTLFGIPMTALTGEVIDLETIVGAGVGRLMERLRNAPSVLERLGLLERFLLRRLGAGSEIRPEVRLTLRRLCQTRGQVAMADIVAEAGVSSKRLGQRFAACVGVTPKRYARLLRYVYAIEMLSAGRTNLRTIAYACGFYDQAHFNREFKSFTSVSPSLYLRDRGPDGTSLVVD